MLSTDQRLRKLERQGDYSALVAHQARLQTQVKLKPCIDISLNSNYYLSLILKKQNSLKEFSSRTQRGSQIGWLRLYNFIGSRRNVIRQGIRLSDLKIPDLKQGDKILSATGRIGEITELSTETYYSGGEFWNSFVSVAWEKTRLSKSRFYSSGPLEDFDKCFWLYSNGTILGDPK